MLRTEIKNTLNRVIKKLIPNKRATASFLCFSMSMNFIQSAWAETAPSNKEVQQYVSSLDKIMATYNESKDATPKRTTDFVMAYEKFVGKKLSPQEMNFISKSVVGTQLPRLEIKGNFIKIYNGEASSKDLLLTIEIVDASKHLFKFGGKTFELSPTKSIEENVQKIIQELQKNPEVSYLDRAMSIFGISQAHAEMSSLMKFVLVGVVALVVGLAIGRNWGKNSEKKAQAKREAEAAAIDDDVIAETEVDTGIESDVVDSSHSTDTSVDETPVTTGEDVQLVLKMNLRAESKLAA